MKKDYSDRGIEYAEKIVSGEIFVCGYVKKACQRHLDDLKRQSTEGFPYRFDRDKANRVCRFIECFHVFEGPLAGEHLMLQPWQCWLLTNLFGWVHDGGRRDGKRRFRRSYIEVPRGAGKSALASTVALYMLSADGEGGAQVIAASTSRKVATIVLGASQVMARREPEFMQALGVEVLAHDIIQKKTASRFWALAADAKTTDGLNLHMACVDELHLHNKRALFDSIETGLGKRDQSLMFCITTAGTDIAGICYEQHTYLTKILDQVHQDESTFGVIYTVPEGYEDQWFDPKVWEACNPGWGITNDIEQVKQLAEKAIVTPAARNNFLTKYLCVWTSADSAWMDMTKWNSNRDNNLSIEDFKGEPCYIGLDLANKSDICAKVYIFQREVEGKSHYYAFAQSYLPEVAITLGKNSQYSGWEYDGLLTVTDGDVTDFSTIEMDLLADAKKFKVIAVAYDPWQATQISQRMAAEGLPMIEVGMNVRSLSEPMKEIESLTRQNRFHHNNPILDWCVSNVTVMIDRNENIFPRKQRPENKIDLLVAAIIAMAPALENGFGSKPEPRILSFSF